MNEKTKKIISKIIYHIVLLFLIWIMSSYVNIAVHNKDGDRQYAFWNFFTLLVKIGEEDTSTETSEEYDSYECCYTVTELPTAGFASADLTVVSVDIESEPINRVEAEIEECPYTDDEVYLLSHLIYAEAGNCSDSTLEMVGCVALNRVSSSLYPNDLYSVIYQRGQYACTWDGNFNKTPTEREIEIAMELLEYWYENDYTTYIPSNVLGQAGFVPNGWSVYTYQDGIYFTAY